MFSGGSGKRGWPGKGKIARSILTIQRKEGLDKAESKEGGVQASPLTQTLAKIMGRKGRQSKVQDKPVKRSRRAEKRTELIQGREEKQHEEVKEI